MSEHLQRWVMFGLGFTSAGFFFYELGYGHALKWAERLYNPKK